MPLPYEPDNDRFEPYDRYRSGNLRLSRYFDLGAPGGPEPAWELGVMTARGEAHVACGAGHDPTDIAHNLRDIERRGASRPLPERAAVERILATVGLFDAAALNDVQGARDWLERGADVDGRNQEGQTPLISAAADEVWSSEGGEPAVLRLLLENGADPNAIDRRRRTALQFAAAHSDGAAIRLLCEYGADINARDDCGQTALHYAVATGNVANATFLVGRGADVDIRDAGNRTALEELAASPFWSEDARSEVMAAVFGREKGQGREGPIGSYDHLVDRTDVATVKQYLRRDEAISEVIVVGEGASLGEVSALLDERADPDKCHSRAFELARRGIIRFAVEDTAAVPSEWKPYVVPIDQYAGRSCRVVYAPPAYYMQVEGQGRFEDFKPPSVIEGHRERSETQGRVSHTRSQSELARPNELRDRKREQDQDP